MSLLYRLADRVLNRPLLITPEKAQVIVSVLGGRIGAVGPSADRFEGSPYQRDENGDVKTDKYGSPVYAPYRITPEGVAVISIVGSLVNRGAYVGASSGLVSYEGVKHQVKAARDDKAVRAVILDIQSPGGEAIGAFETAEQVRLLAAEKRTIALVNGMAASAAYAIASAATEIVTTPSGVCGSIGVVLLHADMSKALAEDGVKPTLIFAGAHKVDGNPFEPLSDQVRRSLQAEVDSLYQNFLETVAAGRGERLTAEMARATEAKCFMGRSANRALDAVANGLADRVGTFETVLKELSSAQAGRAHVQARGMTMDKQTEGPGAETPGITQDQFNAAVSKADADGRRAGAEAERARISAILSTEGVAGNAARMNHALELAAAAPDLPAEKVAEMTVKHVAVSADAAPGMRLEDRQADADPLGGASDAPSAGRQALNVSAIYARHNGR